MTRYGSCLSSIVWFPWLTVVAMMMIWTTTTTTTSMVVVVQAQSSMLRGRDRGRELLYHTPPTKLKDMTMAKAKSTMGDFLKELDLGKSMAIMQRKRSPSSDCQWKEVCFTPPLPSSSMSTMGGGGMKSSTLCHEICTPSLETMEEQGVLVADDNRDKELVAVQTQAVLVENESFNANKEQTTTINKKKKKKKMMMMMKMMKMKKMMRMRMMKKQKNSTMTIGPSSAPAPGPKY
ncbi:hypothetical protein ACA910_003355 [Epithemia clementina (nom. ined.)]